MAVFKVGFTDMWFDGEKAGITLMIHPAEALTAIYTRVMHMSIDVNYISVILLQTVLFLGTV